ncbi:MAG: hypothetical protein V6Z89_02155 [Desulfobacter sp.]
MTTEISEIAKKLITASKELKFRMETPFTIQYGNKKLQCLAFLPDFGGKNGMVLDLIFPPTFEVNSELESACQMMDIFLSSINAIEYQNYNKKIFMEALIDWGYYGTQDEKPKWINQELGM